MSGLTALEKLAQADAAGTHWQIAILDMQMPEMDGADLADTLALLLHEPAAPVEAPLLTQHVLREMRHEDERENTKAPLHGRILLAEDNLINQRVALGILKKLGLEADAVAHGREAIQGLRERPYALVLMDVQMPEMDGLEATRHIRDTATGVLNPAIPIIAMTANAMQGDQQACLEAGMDDYLAKPVSAQALAAMLEKWLVERPST